MKPSGWLLSIEGHVVMGPYPFFLHGVAAFFSSYYVFNLEYPAAGSSTLEFIQRCFLGINPERGSKTKKRTTMNPHWIEWRAGQVICGICRVVSGGVGVTEPASPEATEKTSLPAQVALAHNLIAQVKLSDGSITLLEQETTAVKLQMEEARRNQGDAENSVEQLTQELQAEVARLQDDLSDLQLTLEGAQPHYHARSFNRETRDFTASRERGDYIGARPKHRTDRQGNDPRSSGDPQSSAAWEATQQPKSHRPAKIKATGLQSHQGTATQSPSDKPKPQLPPEQSGTGTSESAEILKLLKELMQRKPDKRTRKDQAKPDSA
ncbi:hypothetical protein Q8A67_024284 [Cirrhinus molitorella]|uniref:Uncharacterized protein n=1 Tax=Cirrhinus molitorella TaxID=172907 RepID=A0AA88P448_9TELE|nr:hypothetical protein Q8A67_024284 [Cirrhinus molitorella]